MRRQAALERLPSTYVEDDAEAETLEVTLADEPAGIEVDLRFTIFRGRPVIARSATIRNVGAGHGPCSLRDEPGGGPARCRLAPARPRRGVGTRAARRRAARSCPAGSPSSTRGASSAQHNPFLALRRPTTDEAHGEAYGFSLVYSGNFLAEAEVDPYGTTRVRLGIEPDTFGWRLEPGASFTTPEAIVA